ncbi:MAG: hypothetical protein KC416_07850 [Myxococcales bacterium]|nr:hypothetical protein [Myxococcales bacterium]
MASHERGPDGLPIIHDEASDTAPWVTITGVVVLLVGAVLFFSIVPIGGGHDADSAGTDDHGEVIEGEPSGEDPHDHDAPGHVEH